MSHPVTAQDVTEERPSRPPERSNRLAAAPVAIAALAALYAGLFGWLSLHRYWAYQMHALDMGNMGQAAWNTIHGHPFFFTNVRLPWAMEAWNTTTRLSFHVEPLFPVISLIYLVWPHPESLLILQTAALALGVIPVYLLALDLLHSRLCAAAFVLAYLCFPTLQAMNLYEFHAVSLAAPFLLAAFLFAERRQYVPFMAFCALAAGTKEEIGLIVACFGIYVALVNGNRRVGIGTAAVGTAWSLFAVLVIEHHYRQPGTLTYLHTRYGYLGHGIRGVIDTLLHDPGAIGNVLFVPAKASYLRFLLVPVGLLALLAPEALLLGAPTLALNLSSSDFHMYSGVGDNSSELIAVVVIASILGAARLIRWSRVRMPERAASRVIAGYVVVVALATQSVFGYSPLGPNYEAAPIGAHQRLADRFVSMVPDGVPVATQDQLDPHLSSRHYLYLFGDTGRQPPLVPANDVVLDVSAPTYAWTPTWVHDQAMTLLRHGWHVVAAQDGLIYLRNGGGSTRIPTEFYSFLTRPRPRPQTPLRGTLSGLLVLGFDRELQDRPNHRIPNAAFAVYLRAKATVRSNLTPVVFEVVDGAPIGCTSSALGLDWLPTTRWSKSQAYRVALQPIETQISHPATAHFLLDVQQAGSAGCDVRWKQAETRRADLQSLGTLDANP